jgi:flagellar motility protein MotE (MotC chaperone)
MIKKIIMVTVVGLISFAGAFAFAWFTQPAPENQSDESNQPAVTASDSIVRPMLPQPEAGMTSPVDSTLRRAMTETRLKSLAIEIREKIEEYNNKIQALELQAQRLKITRDALKKDIENLNNLQIELASTVAGLKEQRAKLLKTRVDIDKAEKSNLVSIAATYDKMDAMSAGKILTNMCKKQGQSVVVVGKENSGLQDAVKILHYMTERTKAKVLAELVTSEPQLASLLCQRLKQISEI